MNRQPKQLFLAGLCCLIVASSAPAQSHRPIGIDIGDLSQAESLLAQRLHHTHNLDDLHDLLQQFRDNPALLNRLKGMRPEDLRKLEDVARNNPSLLDDPKFGDLLNQVDKLKRGETLDDDKKKELANLAKDLLGKHGKDLSSLSHPGDAASGGPAGTTPPPPPTILSGPTPSTASTPNWLNHDLVNGMASVLKDIDRTPEGQKLRDDLLRGIANSDAGRSGPPSALADFFKELISSQQAGWLAHNLKPPSMPNMGGWAAPPALSAAPSVGGDADGMLDAAVWVIVLALIGAAVWMAFRAARRQAAAARPKDWSPGPWPVRPSQVSTREDLIRAFEHLAYLCLGRTARTLNHLDVAAQMGRARADRAGAAGRLAHLYEQARYAPPDEPLPPDELTAARGDLTALAGAAA